MARSLPQKIANPQRVRYLAQTLGLVLLGLVVAASISYLLLPSQVERLEGQRLEALAQTAAVAIQVERHTKIVQGYLNRDASVAQTAEFREIHEAFQAIQQAHKISGDISTFIRPKWKSDTMIYMATSNPRPYVGNGLPITRDAARMWDTGLATRSSLFKDRDGQWISVFFPLKNSKGMVYAGIQLDSRVDTALTAQTRRWSAEWLIAGGAALILVTLLSALLSFRAPETTERLKEMTLSVVRDGLSARFESDLGGEAGRLAAALNQLFSAADKKNRVLVETCRDADTRLANRTAELNEKDQFFSSLMEGMSAGFIAFASDGGLLPMISSSASKYFHEPAQGAKIWDVIGYEQSELGPEIAGLFLDPETAADKLRRFPALLDQAENRRVLLEYHPVFGESRKLIAVGVFATDRTRELQTAAQSLKESARMKQFSHLVLNRGPFLQGIAFIDGALREMKSELEKNSQPDFSLAVFHDRLSGLRERATYFSLSALAQLAQTADLESHEFVSAPTRIARAVVPKLSERLGELETAFKNLLEENGGFLRSELDPKTRHRSVLERELLEFDVTLRETVSAPEVISQFEGVFVKEPIGRYFGHMSDILQAWAAHEGKQLKPLKITGGESRVYASSYGDLFLALERVLRNAVQHGIESPEKRERNGKDLMGTIQLSCVVAPGMQGADEWMTLAITDDGAGIDAKEIRAELRHRGRQREADVESDHEVLQHLFDGGFGGAENPAESLKELSSLMREMGGLAEIHSSAGMGTTITLLVPLTRVPGTVSQKAA